MKKGGNAVDAAIAATLCVGTVSMFASGIGGGNPMGVLGLSVGPTITLNPYGPNSRNALYYSILGSLGYGVYE